MQEGNQCKSDFVWESNESVEVFCGMCSWYILQRTPTADKDMFSRSQKMICWQMHHHNWSTIPLHRFDKKFLFKTLALLPGVPWAR